MSSPSLSCPYCNAILTESDLRSDRGRVLCPRCGETFPLPTGNQPSNPPVVGQEGLARSPLTTHHSPVTTAHSPFSNRAIAFSILAFMGLLAAGFFWYAW